MEGARGLAVAELQHQGRDWGWQVPPTWSRLFMDARATLHRFWLGCGEREAGPCRSHPCPIPSQPHPRTPGQGL